MDPRVDAGGRADVRITFARNSARFGGDQAGTDALGELVRCEAAAEPDDPVGEFWVGASIR